MNKIQRKEVHKVSEVLQDLSTSALTNAIEANLYAVSSLSHHWPQAEVYAGADLSWCITDIPFPWCNAIFRAQLKPEHMDDTIDTIIAKGRAKNVPLIWFIGQATRPANLGEILEAHGFTHQGDPPGMAIDLLAMNEDITIPSNLTITRVQDIETLKTWCHVVVSGYGFSDFTEPALLEWFEAGVKLQLPLQFYLGWWEGKPVATSLLFLAEGVAGIYLVATVPEARRQGIGFAITLAPLQAAQRMGYRVGTLQASQMGVSVYRKMGFQEYCNIGFYVWLNEPSSLSANQQP